MLVFLKIARVLKHSSYWFKRIWKATSTLMKGIPKAANVPVNVFRKAPQKILEIHKKCINWRLLTTFGSPFATAAAFSKTGQIVRIFRESCWIFFYSAQRLQNKQRENYKRPCRKCWFQIREAKLKTFSGETVPWMPALTKMSLSQLDEKRRKTGLLCLLLVCGTDTSFLCFLGVAS